ncbi:acyl-coenzyme A thioesterase 13 isoform X1 [Alligator sinensis]|uniref:Acyl-coenzyme A thioesterase 13 n=2 Tax=Alligator sinensis TaxID=38654 RepID=A0A1U7SMI1_ALLSI|nr:acyl-coenzyme A thioesterase 13 isoform X1 [Alligator sinensis]
MRRGESSARGTGFGTWVAGAVTSQTSPLGAWDCFGVAVVAAPLCFSSVPAGPRQPGLSRPASPMGSLTLQSLREVMKSLLDSPGFDRVLDKMKLLSATPGKVVCEMKVEEQHTNRAGTLHGGLTATLVDVVSTTALLYTERGAPGVSVDMNITYMSAAKIGEEVLITAQVLKQGRSIAFASVDLTNKATGKLIAQGRHTKYLGT